MNSTFFGDGPRFSPVAFNDHAGQLWIVTILALVYSSLVSTARAYVKYKMFGIDDLLIASATVSPFTCHLSELQAWPNCNNKF